MVIFSIWDFGQGSIIYIFGLFLLVMIIEAVIYLLILLTVIPFGLVLAKLCEDELIKDRRYFMILSKFLLITSVAGLIFYRGTSIILAPIYMVLVLLVMIKKSDYLIKSKK